jgi:hypothetical protein
MSYNVISDGNSHSFVLISFYILSSMGLSYFNMQMMDDYENVMDWMNFCIHKLFFGTVCSRDEKVRIWEFIRASCNVGAYWTVEDRQSIVPTEYVVDIKQIITS